MYGCVDVWVHGNQNASTLALVQSIIKTDCENVLYVYIQVHLSTRNVAHLRNKSKTLIFDGRLEKTLTIPVVA